MKRRRFLTLTAAALAVPGSAVAATWQGTALGADVLVTLTGPRAAQDLQKVQSTLSGFEAIFSLYQPSALTALNANGSLSAPPALLVKLCRIVTQVHHRTGGHFDPTVQPLWTALAQGSNIAAARALIGWHRVSAYADRITLAPGQALTFNGIAQGFATDIVTAQLAAAGYRRALVNIGEYRSLGGPYRIAIADPEHGELSQLTLDAQAVATSSPAAMTVGGGSHILPARGAAPLWSSVTVTAPTAAIADALSTAFCLMDRTAIRSVLADLPDTAAHLVDLSGNLSRA